MGAISTQKLRSYTGPRKDVIGLVQQPPRRILDLGCSDGSLGAALMDVYDAAEVHGVEYDLSFVETARGRLASVIQADLNTGDLTGFPQDVDLLICADVLEHTIQPLENLKTILAKCTTEDAYVILSLPNVQHITVILNLFRGIWPERDRGIFDRTHLRWFTLKSIYDMAEAADLEVQILRRNFRLADRSGGKLNRYAKYFAYLPLKNFFTYQYVVLLKRRRNSELGDASRSADL
mgnify:CR=1 FL=1